MATIRHSQMRGHITAVAVDGRPYRIRFDHEGLAQVPLHLAEALQPIPGFHVVSGEEGKEEDYDLVPEAVPSSALAPSRYDTDARPSRRTR
jgi:hypothetical protein